MSFSYPQERVNALKPRFAALATEFPGYVHTGHKDNLNDFTSADGSKHISVKTIKEGSWKICPQLIGQPSRSKFCPTFGLPLDISNDDNKSYIVSNVLSMMPKYTETTFHCPLLFYHEKKNICQIITLTTQLPWTDVILTFTHLEKNKAWNESSTVHSQRLINGKQIKNTVGEFQLHNDPKRPHIKFRFDLKGILATFQSALAFAMSSY
jgi:hypothetical protein